jgi:homopolymeric O-antigen transport system ATP-binding protein
MLFLTIIEMILQMLSDDISISVRNVTKTYRIFGHTGERLKQAITFGLRKYHKEYTALKDISFDIKKGETIGIIGRNGAGKSTLLQLICGILKPSSGTVQVNGRISAMLELGAGFHPEFTGRENVFFQGSLMGLTQNQMAERFDDIEAFAGIGEFIDLPVRTYSSGMFTRLAFAVAVHVEPDILIIDEVLAVGDVNFQQKCFDQINRMQSKNITIIVVSHDAYQLERLCHRAAVLNKGKLSDFRPAKEILTSYHELLQEEQTKSKNIIANSREGTHEVSFEKVFIETKPGSEANIVLSTETMCIVADVVTKKAVNNIRFRFELYSSNNDLVTMVSTIGLSEGIELNGKHRVIFTMNQCQLTSGWYYLNAIVGNRNVLLDAWRRAVDFKVLLRDEKARNLSKDTGIFISQGEWKFLPASNELQCVD